MDNLRLKLQCPAAYTCAQYGLECLANLDQLPARGFRVTVLPLKLEGGTGGPCRVVAVID